MNYDVATATRRPASPRLRLPDLDTSAPDLPSELPTRRHDLVSRLVRYGAVGLLGTALYFLTVLFLVEKMGADPVVAASVATVLVIVVNYVLNRSWVFESNRDHRTAFPRFLLIAVVSLLLNTGVMYVTVHVLSWWYVAGLVIATLVVPPTNFALNHWCFD